MGNGLFFFALLLVVFSLQQYVKNRERMSVGLLAAGAFLVRLGVAAMDPFLHDWDEKFHALVAKNMMTAPFRPMLRVHPVLSYDYTSWCCNHIWLHKQPLFMWQMALSMKIFGVNEMAVRLPSALLSAGMVWGIYRIALIWTGQFNTAYIAALLSAFSWFQIEMVSGAMSLDHNDIVFTAYITGSIWAFCEYSREQSWRWVILTGCFVGCAILVKWLTGLLVFGGWGLWIVLKKDLRLGWKNYRDLLAALVIATAIALPWQLYILHAFPQESAYEYGYNYQHITEKLGAYVTEDWRFHFQEWTLQYGNLLLPFLAVGLLSLLSKSSIKSSLTIPMLAMTAVVYGFFSFIVQTKMPAFVYIVCPILLTATALGLRRLLQVLDRLSLNKRWMHVPVLLVLAFVALRPAALLTSRSVSDDERNAKIANTRIFKKIHDLPENYLVFNCKSYEDIDMMFYNRYNAHSWCPSEKDLDSLLSAGYKIAVFQAHKGKELPGYVATNPEVLIIAEEFK